MVGLISYIPGKNYRSAAQHFGAKIKPYGSYIEGTIH